MSKLLIYTFLAALAICSNATDSGGHRSRLNPWVPFWWDHELQEEKSGLSRGDLDLQLKTSMVIYKTNKRYFERFDFFFQINQLMREIRWKVVNWNI